MVKVTALRRINSESVLLNQYRVAALFMMTFTSSFEIRLAPVSVAWVYFCPYKFNSQKCFCGHRLQTVGHRLKCLLGTVTNWRVCASDCLLGLLSVGYESSQYCYNFSLFNRSWKAQFLKKCWQLLRDTWINCAGQFMISDLNR